MDLFIRNISHTDNIMALMYLGLYIAGQQDVVLNSNVIITTKRGKNGNKVYLIQDKNKNDDVSWRDAAEGLARYIEEQNINK